MTDGDSADRGSPDDRMDWFAADAEELACVESTTRFEHEVAVSVRGDRDKLTTDLRPLFRAVNRYSLTVFDGEIGDRTAEFHARPAEWGDDD